MATYDPSFYQEHSPSEPGWSSQFPKNSWHISTGVQNHLTRVYLSLCCALVVSAVGVYLHLSWNIGGFFTTLGFIGSIIWLLSTDAYPSHGKKRLGLLMLSALFQGASMGPLIGLVIDFDPRILVSAFVGTALAFGCFSAAAILARRREYFYLGGLLSSALTILFWLQYASSTFGGSAAFFKFQLYFGLLVFLGSMVVDTQVIIEKAYLGDLDYVAHSLLLYIDVVAVFIRLLLIMTNKKMESSEKEKKKRATA